MRTAGAKDKDRYPSRSAKTRKSTSTSRMSWAPKTRPRISAPATNSTSPIFRWQEMPIFVWCGAARFRKLNSTCATAESIASVRRATSRARGDPQPACTSAIRMGTYGNSSSTHNRIVWKETHSKNTLVRLCSSPCGHHAVPSRGGINVDAELVEGAHHNVIDHLVECLRMIIEGGHRWHHHDTHPG